MLALTKVPTWFEPQFKAARKQQQTAPQKHTTQAARAEPVLEESHTGLAEAGLNSVGAAAVL